MSRIGKQPVKIADGVSYTFAKDRGEIIVKGPKGELTQKMDTSFDIAEEDGHILIKRPTEQKRHRAMHGLYRSLIANMVEGVTTGYQLKLELVGVGYKASEQNNVLELALGYSHNIFFAVPKEIKVSAETEKGKNPTVTVTGIDKQLVGQVAAKIKSLRSVEPYKGKGIRFVGEKVRRKAGKQASK